MYNGTLMMSLKLENTTQ